MTSGEFEELLNLYLDKTITPQKLSLLRKEISGNSERRKLYEQYYYLHQASRLVLKKRHHSFLPYIGLMAACLVGIGSFVALNPWRTEEQLNNRQISAATTQGNVEKIILEKDLLRADSFFKDSTDFHFTLDRELSRPWNSELEYIQAELGIPIRLEQSERGFFSSEGLDPNQGFEGFNSRLVRLPER